MSSFNKIIIMGNLTRDPELKQVGAGSVCRLGIASNRQYKNNQGVMVQEVCYVDVDVWGAQAETSNRYLQKGRLVLIEGRLKLDTWESEGQKRSKHSIAAEKVTFLPSTSQGDSTNTGTRDAANPFADFNTEPEAPKAAREATTKPAVKVERRKAAPAAPTAIGEVVMSDEQPFEDDLPF